MILRSKIPYPTKEGVFQDAVSYGERFGYITDRCCNQLGRGPLHVEKGIKKELWLFSILLFVAVGISCAKALHWLIPTPLDWITAVYRPFSDFLTHIGLIR